MQAKSQSLRADGGQAQADVPKSSKVKAAISGDPTTDACLAPEMPGYSWDTGEALPAGKVYGQHRGQLQSQKTPGRGFSAGLRATSLRGPGLGGRGRLRRQPSAWRPQVLQCWSPSSQTHSWSGPAWQPPLWLALDLKREGCQL